MSRTSKGEAKNVMPKKEPIKAQIKKYDPTSTYHKYTTEYIESEILRLGNRREDLLKKRRTKDKKKSAELGAIYKSLPTEEENQIRTELKRFHNLRSRRKVAERKTKKDV